MSELKEQRYIIEIAKVQGVAKAAENLFISQPALSKFLTRTEEMYGVQLFERVGKKMIPTYAGKQYLEYDIKESRYTQEEAEDVLNQKLKIYLLDLIENKVQILHNGVTINDSGTDYVMAGTITADMPAVGYAAVTMPEIEGNEETKAVQ